MTTINFPSNPSLNDSYEFGNRKWVWNGTYWRASSVTIGYTGSQGDIGYTGSTGVDGPQGNLGYTGSQGDTGSTGVDGPQGNLGYTGSAGVGYTGSAGLIGYTGSSGGAVTVLERHYKKTGTLTVSAGLERWYMPLDSTINSIVARVETAPTGSGIELLVKIVSPTDIVESSITLNINTTSNISQLYTDTISVLTNYYVTVEIINIGTDIPGSNLTVTFTYTRN